MRTISENTNIAYLGKVYRVENITFRTSGDIRTLKLIPLTSKLVADKRYKPLYILGGLIIDVVSAGAMLEIVTKYKI